PAGWAVTVRLDPLRPTILGLVRWLPGSRGVHLPAAARALCWWLHALPQLRPLGVFRADVNCPRRTALDQGDVVACLPLAVVALHRSSAHVKGPNDCVHLPGRRQGTCCLEKPSCGPVKCNALFGPLRHLSWPCRRACRTTPQTLRSPLQSTQ